MFVVVVLLAMSLLSFGVYYVSLNPDTVPRLQRNPERACPCLPWFYGRSARQIPIVPSTTDVIFPGLSGNGMAMAAPDG